MNGFLLLGIGTAAAIDLATRRIPNSVVGVTALLGLVAAAAGASDVTVASSAAGLLLGVLLLLPGHRFGATGAGDVKLLGAAGAVLGAERIVWAFLYTAIAGGLLAVGVALNRRLLGETVSRGVALLAGPAASRPADDTAASRRFAYGPAIAAGSLLAFWLGR